MTKILCLIVPALWLIVGASANAALISASDYKTIRIEYNAVVTKSPTDNVQILQPDGRITPFRGPIPDYPFKAGDPLKISFDAVVPSREAINKGLIPAAADGIYQFELGPNIANDNSIIFNFPNLGAIGNLTGNGGIKGAGSTKSVNPDNIAIVYDANSDSYSINPNFDQRSEDGRTFFVGGIETTVLTLNPQSFVLTSRQLSDGGSTFWEGFADGSGRIPVAAFGPSDQILLVDKFLEFDGGFNLPFFSGQSPTPVPAPSALLLFSIGVCALIRSRKRKSAT